VEETDLLTISQILHTLPCLFLLMSWSLCFAELLCTFQDLKSSPLHSGSQAIFCGLLYNIFTCTSYNSSPVSIILLAVLKFSRYFINFGE
jgi:hypothetical protein